MSALPRFVYRRLAAPCDQRPAAQAADRCAVTELLTGKDPDLRKFKFFVPGFLKQKLSPDELAQFERQTAKRQERASQLKMVFPHVADEFSVDEAFLDLAFEWNPGRRSCAATVSSPSARALRATSRSICAVNGRRAKLGLAEDLNSPMSNAFLLQMMGRTVAEQLDILKRWINTIFPDLADGEKNAVAAQKQRESSPSCTAISKRPTASFSRPPMWSISSATTAATARRGWENIFPKFIAMPVLDHISPLGLRRQSRGKGAARRLATYSETLEAIQTCSTSSLGTMRRRGDDLAGADRFRDRACHAPLKSAIEVDCVSKWRLRSAFDDASRPSDDGRGDLVFSAVEMVRLDRRCAAEPAFGLEDAVSWYVTSPILNGISSLFSRIHHLFRRTRRQA